MQIAPVFVCLMMVALAQGSSLGTVKDISFNLAGQEVHIPSQLFKRQIASPDAATNDKTKPGPGHGGGDSDFNGKNCGTVSIPARVAIQFCGCNDPACPSCPCRK